MLLSFHCFVTFIIQGGLFSGMVLSRYCLQGQIDMSGLGTKNLLLVLLSSGSSEPHKLLTSKEHWVSSPPPDMIDQDVVHRTQWPSLQTPCIWLRKRVAWGLPAAQTSVLCRAYSQPPLVPSPCSGRRQLGRAALVPDPLGQVIFGC